jgi:transposase-like protein
LLKKGYTPEQIINKLREAEVMTARGETMDSAMRRLGVTKNTFYRWRKEYGGLRVDRAKRLKELETENSRLKRLVADLSLDVSILREAVSGNF